MTPRRNVIVVPAGRSRWWRRPWRRGVYAARCNVSDVTPFGVELFATERFRKCWTVRGAQRWLRRHA